MWYVVKEDELCHHGILGQKWGIRRYQNADGSLTAAGRRRYGVTTTDSSGKRSMVINDSDSAVTKRVKKDWNSMSDAQFRKKYQTTKDVYEKRVTKYGDPYMKSPLAKAGKKLSGVSKQEKKGKVFETPEEVAKAAKKGLERKRANRQKAVEAIVLSYAALNLVAAAAILSPEITKSVNNVISNAKNYKVHQFNAKYGDPVWTDNSYITDLVKT